MAYNGGRGGGGRFPWGAGYGGGGGGGGGWPGQWGGRGQQVGWWGAGESSLARLMAMRAPPPSSIRPGAVRAGEAAAREVVLRVHPTEEAERRRQDVIGYVKRLIGTSLGAEVFAFGSVPLKTYLPDGDVDVTVLGSTSLDSTFINDVQSVLESEVQNRDAEFELKGLQFINAEVKLIKCVIENIVVDISFNQVGGVSTLSFLEMVDQKVGKDHLFKRSILLIKTWCYHESRILGAHHGLISTYGLETLILYIFNMFHKSLNGPLEALYTFLEYFSKFDWEHYCISLNGPIAFSALSNLTDDSTTIYDELLLGKEYMNDAWGRLLVLPENSGGCNSKFRLKHLNIIDPLKGSNNLGRSVSKGSFYRIRSAFAFGAQKLGQILLLPSELIPDEIYGFFANTLERHGTGERSDLGNSGLSQYLLGPEKALSEDFSDLEISDMDEGENRSPRDSLEMSDKELNIKPDIHKTSSRYLPGDAQGRPWNKIWFTKPAADCNNTESGANFSSKSPYLAGFRNHIPFSPENGDGNTKQCSKDSSREESSPLTRSFGQRQIYSDSPHILTSTRTNTLDVTNSFLANGTNWNDRHEEKLLLSPFSPNLLDLSGDLELHLGCLRKVQYHLEYLFFEFIRLVESASSSGDLDEDSFMILVEMLTVSFLSNTDGSPPELPLASSTDTKRWNSPPVYYSRSTGNVPQQSHAEVQSNAVCQHNVALPSGTYTLCNRMPLSPSLVANPDSYHASWFATEDIPKIHATDAYLSQNGLSLPSGTDCKTNELAFSPSPPADLENYPVSWPCIIGDIPKIRGTGTYIPKMSYDTYKERMPSEKGRKQKLSSLDRLVRIQHTLCNNFQRYNSFEQGHSGPNDQLTAVQNEVDQILMKQNNLQQDIYSSESLVSNGDLVSFDDQSSTSSGMFPSCGNNDLENRQASTSQPSSPATKGNYHVENNNLEFGSMGAFPFRLLPEFTEAFPPLPTIKGSSRLPTKKGLVQVPASSIQDRVNVIRAQGSYKLRDDVDFPPLQAVGTELRK